MAQLTFASEASLKARELYCLIQRLKLYGLNRRLWGSLLQPETEATGRSNQQSTHSGPCCDMSQPRDLIVD